MNRRPHRPIRFLFLHSETGGGHRRVAQAVADTLTDRYAESVHIQQLDALADYAPWPFCRIPNSYASMLRAGGYPYGAIFQLLNGQQRAQALSKLFAPLVSPAAKRLLADQPADLIVIFHPLLVHTLTRTMAQCHTSIPLVALGTDLIVMHAFWADPAVHHYLVATEAAQKQLLCHNIPGSKITVTGLPLGRQFTENTRESPQALRVQLGLDPALPLVLVMGGGEGVGPMKSVACTVASAGLEAQIVILTGRNESLYTQLTQCSWPGAVRIQRFTDDVHLWIKTADLLVTKAGPTTIAESLVLGIPLVLWGAIPAQETPNVRWVVEAGAGRWAPGPRQTLAAIRELLHNPTARQRLRQQARHLIPKNGADQAATVLWEMAHQ